MSQQPNSIPFGLHFAVTVTDPGLFRLPQYDPQTDISYVEDANGLKIPFVDLRDPRALETVTEIELESTDEEQLGLNLMATGTVTKERQEDTDSDPSEFGLMATETNATKAQVDTSDIDQ